MAQVQIAIRNESDRAMTSINGTIFLALLTSNGTVIGQQNVDIMWADADFSGLAPGNYTAVAIHPEVRPNRASYDFGIQQMSELIRINFVYSEPERVLLRSYLEIRRP